MKKYNIENSYQYKKILTNNHSLQQPHSIFHMIEDRILLLNGEIDNKITSEICSALFALFKKNNNDIFLYIKSPGGDIYNGLAIVDTISHIQKSNCKINIIGTGLIGSIASVIFVCGSRRLLTHHARIMIHQPIVNDFNGQATDMNTYNKEVKNIKQDILNIYNNKTKTGITTLKKMIERDYFINAPKALQLGFADKII